MKVSIPGLGTKYVGEKEPAATAAPQPIAGTPFLTPAQARASAAARQARADAARLAAEQDAAQAKAHEAAVLRATAPGLQPPHSINDKPDVK